mgnify:CR=1 FL=1
MAHPQEQDRMRAIVRRRHETANERLKNFSILSEPFCHDLTQHGYVFRACASLIQLSIEHGDPLFPVNYNPMYSFQCDFWTLNYCDSNSTIWKLC